MAEFIRQQELIVGNANFNDFDKITRQAVKPQKLPDQTSNSPARGGSSGKRTP